MPKVARLHKEQETQVLAIPLAFQTTLPLLEANQGLHVILPASCPAHCSSVFVGAGKCLWPSAALSMLTGHSQAPAAHAGSATSPALPCSGLFAWCSWCFSAALPEVPPQLKVPLVLFSASLCTPILAFIVYITAETGKNIRRVPAGLFSLFQKSLCELPDGQKRPPASPHGLLHLAALGSATYQAPTAALSPFKFTLHLLESQPAFIFAAFRNIGSKAYLSFANSE